MDHGKKAAEGIILKRFVSNKNLRLIVTGIQPLEPPDFKMKLFQDDTFKNIGVELTRVIDPNLKEHEAAQDLVIKMAHETFKAILPEKLEVYVWFSKATLPLKRNSLKSLSDSLAKIVVDVAKSNTGFIFKVETDTLNLPSEVDKVTVEKNDDGFENWQSFGAFSVPYVDQNWFADIIKRKEAKMYNYTESFDETWLILAANFGHASSHFQFTNLDVSFSESPFDRIFIYLFRDDEVMALKK